MGKPKPTRFRDPIHGFIYLSEAEVEIVDSKAFQRLRNIHQNGMTYLVYPGAEHTRFQHSLGVMHLASNLFDRIVTKNGLESKWGKEKVRRYRQLLRLYALLHDIGHAPFSHAGEDEEGGLFPEGTDHESYTVRIIGETEIRERVDEAGKEYGISADGLIDLIEGRLTDPQTHLLRQLMSSELDVDKMDYLLRDSHYCGVAYGLFDLPRLEDSLTIQDEAGVCRLAVEEGGLHVVEAFILARYYMFAQVYFHRTRRILDYMLRRFLGDVLPDGKFPEVIDEYLAWDDLQVMQLIRDVVSQKTSKWGRALAERKLLKVVHESPIHSSEADRRVINLIEDDLVDEFGPDDVYVDRASKLPHKLPKEMKRDDPNAIFALDRDGRFKPMSDLSVIVKKMTEPINIWRIYAKQGIMGRVKRRYRELEKRSLKH